jgi:hypothetical protein
MSVNGGLVGPKARPKGVVDGQQVNIPALSYDRCGFVHNTNGGTEFDKLGLLWI